MGFDLDAFLDQPLGYSQSNGTIELRERLARLYPGAGVDNIEVTNGTSEANYLVALSQLRPGDEVAMEVPNYMQMPGVARSLGANVQTFRLRQDSRLGAGLGRVRARRSRAGRGCSTCRIPTTRPARCCPTSAMRRIVDRCASTGTWLLADEVYLGAEIDRPRTASFWGMSDRVVVTSGLSKAYGIPGRQGRLDGRPGGAGRRVLDAARLPDHRPEQDVRPDRPRRGRAGQPRAVLRAHPRRSCATTCPSRATGWPASAGA